DEKNLKTVPDIIKRFRQNKQQVIMHLCDRYNIDVNNLDGIDMTAGPANPAATAPATDIAGVGEAALTGEGEEEEEEEEEAPKKKSKILMIIIIVVVTAGLGVGGYFAYSMFLGDGGDHTEEAASDEGAAEEAVSEDGTEEQSEPESEPEPEVPDSLESDSTETDSIAVDGELIEDKAEGNGGE
ncbi:MAG: hypothetical protein JKX74_05370, partial [Flavobacteriales bacterium]|nr:hypothetical protein [Flavobacteriales bacterium]